MPSHLFQPRKQKNRKTKHAASSTPPMRWAARCVVHLYSVDSLVALSRSDEGVMTMIVWLIFWIWDYSCEPAHFNTAFFIYCLIFGFVGVCESISMRIRFDGCWIRTHSWNDPFFKNSFQWNVKFAQGQGLPLFKMSNLLVAALRTANCKAGAGAVRLGRQLEEWRWTRAEHWWE